MPVPPHAQRSPPSRVATSARCSILIYETVDGAGKFRSPGANGQPNSTRIRAVGERLASKTLRNSALVVGARALAKLAVFAVVVLLVRHLGDERYGRFATMVVYVTLVGVVADLGLQTVFIRDVSRNRGEFRRYISNLVGTRFALLLAAGVPLALGFTITTIYAQLDVVLLQVFKGFQMVGWYAAANRFVDAVAWIPQSAMGAVFPALSLVAATESRRLKFAYEKSFKMLAIIALPLAVGIAITADSLVQLAFGHGFDQSIPALRILAPSIALLFVNNAFIYTLTAINRQLDFTRLSLATLVVNIALNLVLIPLYGYLGAAAASTLTEAALFGGGLWLLRGQLAPLRVVGSSGRAMASAAVMGAVLYPIRPWPLGQVVIVGAAG